MGIFVAGSVFSVYEGVHTLRPARESGGILVPFVVLGVSFLAEGTSWLRAVRQLRGEARGRAAAPSGSTSAPARTRASRPCFAEDSAALVGLLLAAAGVGLHHVTGNAAWDGCAAIAIGAAARLRRVRPRAATTPTS